MRRAIAISLLMLFSWTLIAPLVAVDADANLPACCRGKGKCHCRMCKRGNRGGHQKGFAAVAAKCPCCPASATTVYSPTYKPEAAGAFYSETVFHLAYAPRTETHSRITFLHSHPKRGPPAPLA
ncbi:MAG: hypothetical protein ACLQGT_12785 [Terracidiphilus sp.]